MSSFSFLQVSTGSERRILKKGGRQKLQKIWEEHRSEFEIVTLKFRPIFCPKSGEEQKKIFNRPKSGEKQKKGLHSNFIPVFAQN